MCFLPRAFKILARSAFLATIHQVSLRSSFPFFIFGTIVDSSILDQTISISSVVIGISQPFIHLVVRLFLYLHLSCTLFQVTQTFRFYHTGVFTHRDCYVGGPTNHAVLLVGYGNDYRVGGFWWAKNSWGEYWGINGYFQISRDALRNCGIASFPIYPADFYEAQ